MKNCEECGDPVDLKAGDEIVTNVGAMKLGDEEPNMCRACLSTGWSDEPKEVAEGIRNDPELSGKVERLSPIKPEDL